MGWGEQRPGWLGRLEQHAPLSPALLKEAALCGQRDLCWLVISSARRHPDHPQEAA